ncbi:MAG: HD-GYP domain-containing protein, partial [Nitrospirae bacterium]
VQRLKRINEIGRALTTIIESDELMKNITRACAEVLNAERALLHVKDEKDRVLTIKYTDGLGFDTLKDLSVEFSPVFEKIFKENKPVFLTNGETPNKRSLLATPLRFQEKTVGALIVESRKDSDDFTPEELEILSTFANQAVVAIENAWLYEKIKMTYLATIQSLINALEASDKYTKGHSERVRRLATEFGRYLGLPIRDIEILEHAAVLHDVGKIGIDDKILKKPGLLDTDEYTLIKAHPVIGDDILAPIDRFDEIREVVVQHHERYDGKGYPYGLAAEEISFKARILSIVDVFDALMTERPYRPAMPYEQVLQEMKRQAGKQFDPQLVYSFIEMLQEKGLSFLATVGYNLNNIISSEKV